MNWHGAIIIFAKEMRDILRDRRTVISMVLVPILFYPIIAIGIGSLVSSQIERTRAADHHILVLSRDNQNQLITSLHNASQIAVVPKDTVRQVLQTLAIDDTLVPSEAVNRIFGGDPFSVPDSVRAAVYYAAIAAHLVGAVVEFPPDFEDRVVVGDSMILSVYADETDIRSEAAGDRSREWALNVRDSLVNERLVAAGLDHRALKPYWIQPVNVAPAAKRSGFFLAMMLPYMLMILTMTGGMYPALDITAGEKERHTLETLLAAPVSRWHLASGKFLAVLTAAFVTMILATASMTLSVRMTAGDLGGDGASALPLSLSATTVGWIIFLMIPLATLFSAVLLAVAISARSYKEGQSYITPMIMAVILPAMVSFVPGIELEWGFTVVPVVNLCLALKAVLLGVHDPLKIFAVFAVTALYAIFALFVVTRMFQRESVLFRT